MSQAAKSVATCHVVVFVVHMRRSRVQCCTPDEDCQRRFCALKEESCARQVHKHSLASSSGSVAAPKKPPSRVNLKGLQRATCACIETHKLIDPPRSSPDLVHYNTRSLKQQACERHTHRTAEAMPRSVTNRKTSSIALL
jgi:hypothetical protein